jgi:hypothetical protein
MRKTFIVVMLIIFMVFGVFAQAKETGAAKETGTAKDTGGEQVLPAAEPQVPAPGQPPPGTQEPIAGQVPPGDQPPAKTGLKGAAGLSAAYSGAPSVALEYELMIMDGLGVIMEAYGLFGDGNFDEKYDFKDKRGMEFGATLGITYYPFSGFAKGVYFGGGVTEGWAWWEAKQEHYHSYGYGYGGYYYTEKVKLNGFLWGFYMDAGWKIPLKRFYIRPKLGMGFKFGEVEGHGYKEKPKSPYFKAGVSFGYLF